MPKACVKQKMKQGMSRKAAIQACYPLTKKVSKEEVAGRRERLKSAAKTALEIAVPAYGLAKAGSRAVKGIKKRRTIKAIKKSKPPKMEIRKSASPMEKKRRRKKAKSMRKGY